jgi:hypothetical protein
MALLTAKQKPFALEWEAGTTVPLTIHYNRLDGSIPDLTISGSAIWVTFKNQVSNNDPGVLQKTLANGKVTITDAVNGVAIAYMTPAESVIGPDWHKIYQVDVKVKEANGDEWVAAYGTLTLVQTATKTV